MHLVKKRTLGVGVIDAVLVELVVDLAVRKRRHVDKHQRPIIHWSRGWLARLPLSCRAVAVLIGIEALLDESCSAVRRTCPVHGCVRIHMRIMTINTKAAPFSRFDSPQRHRRSRQLSIPRRRQRWSSRAWVVGA